MRTYEFALDDLPIRRVDVAKLSIQTYVQLGGGVGSVLVVLDADRDEFVRLPLDPLEDVREARPTDVAKVIDGAGACPPENCGGPRRYMELVRALRDPSQPDHDDAVECLGRDYDPSAYQPALFA